MIVLDENITFVKGSKFKKYSLRKHLKEIKKLTQEIDTFGKNQKNYRTILIERAINYYCITDFEKAIIDLTTAIKIKESSWIYYMRGFIYNFVRDRESSRKDYETAQNIKDDNSDDSLGSSMT